MDNSKVLSQTIGLEIAIIGMSGRFPGANSVDQFWQNLRDGVETISFFSDEDLLASGVDPEVFKMPDYVRASGILDGIDLFDASFFSFSPREAEITDPQQRVFLECAWEALENAGYDADRYSGAIGVYAGEGMNTYLLLNLYPTPGLVESVGSFPLMIGNDKDFLPTRVSYKLNLRGPSVAIQTACSTSLVAVHLACQALLAGECDMALAGGVSIKIPHRVGYRYREGGIDSPDGHCCAFDSAARGTVGSSGVGVVILKRLAEAVADGDSIYAIIKGSAINNDGSTKVGYTAPSIEGQAEAIRSALNLAEVEPETITYVEAHGTGTVLGDPVEIAALTKAFRMKTNRKGYCALGSVKTNIGHVDTAAGVAGLIKTALALKHRLLPPSLHFKQPNPQINFAASPFYVNAAPAEWPSDPFPRRAGVSSLGIGGTNAHAILEEAPLTEPSGPSRPWQVLLLSAKTRSALENMTANLAGYLQDHSDVSLADVAYTLHIGRKVCSHRRVCVCQGVADAVTALKAPAQSRQVHTGFQESDAQRVIFMFPGQGAQYVNMGLELYQLEPQFRHQVDLCAEVLQPHLGFDLRQVLYPNEASAIGVGWELDQTIVAQPAIFTVSYALAQLWMSWGVRPEAMIGHSLGEYVAACLSGVLSLEDALALVAVRGRLMQELPEGAMLSVALPEAEIQVHLRGQMAVAAINGPRQCVISGPIGAIDELQDQFARRGVIGRRLQVSHAYHSPMVEPILSRFSEQVRRIGLQPPQIPYLSNVTGNWITAAEATEPQYWSRHLRQAVRFSDGVRRLLCQPGRVFLEVGPGRTLCALVRRHLDSASELPTLASMHHPHEPTSDVAFLMSTVGQLWLSGIQVDGTRLYTQQRRYRVPLPTYPFERQRYWIDAPRKSSQGQKEALEGLELGSSPPEQNSSSNLGPILEKAFIAPRNDLERRIAGIWQEVLGLQQVGIHDNFFELGGDSLLALQLISQVREQFGQNIPLAKFLEEATIEHLGMVIQSS